MTFLRGPMGRALVGAIVALLAVIVANQVRDEPAITVRAPWSRPTPPGVDVTAVYLELRSVVDDSLVGIGVDPAVARSASVHRNVVDAGGRVSMERVDQLALPAGERVVLAPAGALHLMVEGLADPLDDGDRFELVLSFARAGEISADVVVSADRS